MEVPFAAPTRLGVEEAAAVRAAVESVLAGSVWVGGEPVAGFERAFGAYLGLDSGREVVGVGNGTDALALAFAALGLRPGSKILVSNDEGGYAATAAAQLGLGIRVMDLDPDLGVPTARTAAAADDPSLAAVVITHLHGDAVPLDDLDAWRRDRGLLLIEDCAQAHGLRSGGAHVGLVGEAATFSFYPTKNLGAAGDAGAVVVDPETAERTRALREYGWGERYRVEVVGGRNSRLDSLQAAILTARLPFLDQRNSRRREIANRYRSLLRLHGDPATTVAHHAVATLPDHSARESLREVLGQRGIMSAIHYPFLVSEMPGLQVSGGPTPVAAIRRDRILSLPCFPEMSEVEIETVEAALSLEGPQ